MKIFQNVSKILFLFLLIFVCHSRLFAQEVAPLELKLNTSVLEILDYLNKTGFPQARIGIDTMTYEVYSPNNPYAIFSRSAVFSPGFKITKIEGCFLTLRNENVKLLSFGTTLSRDEDRGFRSLKERAAGAVNYPAELYLRLNKMGFAGKKKPYLYMKNAEAAKVFGSWAAKFISGNPEKEGAISIDIPDPRPGFGRDGIEGKNITFVFDDKQTSENFNTALRRAIRLCGGIEFVSSVSGKSAATKTTLR
jgi:hypothetical protein